MNKSDTWVVETRNEAAVTGRTKYVSQHSSTHEHSILFIRVPPPNMLHIMSINPKYWHVLHSLFLREPQRNQLY